MNDDTPQIYLAENAEVISRVLALEVVAKAEPSVFGDALDEVRGHLLHERWAEAVLAWMQATDTPIDVYEEFVPVWTDQRLDASLTSLEIRTAKIFTDTGSSKADRQHSTADR